MEYERFLDLTLLTVAQCRHMGTALMTLREDDGLDLEQLEKDIDIALGATRDKLESMDFQKVVLRIRADYGLYL